MDTPRIIFMTLFIATCIACNSNNSQPSSADSTNISKTVSGIDEQKVGTDTLLQGKKQYAFIVGIIQKNDVTIIDADYIQYLTGQSAIDAAIKAHQADTFKTADGKVHVDVPNDYFILNENTKIRSLVLAKNCVFDLITYLDRTPPVTDNSYSSFIKAYRHSPFILTLNDNNIVVGIKEVFIP